MQRVNGRVVYLGVDKDLKVRRCVDCGEPTTDYRCPTCWAKIRDESDMNNPCEYYSLILSDEMDLFSEVI